MTDKIVAFTACDSKVQATKIARRLVKLKLAACVNILAGARSVYRWKDKIENTAEVILVIKSRRDLFPALSAEIAKLHSYEVPEIIALPVVDGSVAYLGWLDKELREP